MADGGVCMCAAGCVQGINADPQPYHAAARPGPAAVCMRSFPDRWCVACQNAFACLTRPVSAFGYIMPGCFSSPNHNRKRIGIAQRATAENVCAYARADCATT
jgi:hypothetical protein